MPINYPEEMILLLIMALGKSFELKSGQLVLMVVPRALITGRHGVARHFTVAPPTSLLQPIRTSKTKIVGLPSDRFIDVPLVLASHAPLGQALHSLNNQSKKITQSQIQTQNYLSTIREKKLLAKNASKGVVVLALISIRRLWSASTPLASAPVRKYQYHSRIGISDRRRPLSHRRQTRRLISFCRLAGNVYSLYKVRVQ